MEKNRRVHVSILLAILVIAAFATAQQVSPDKIAVYVVARDAAAPGVRRKYANELQASVEDIKHKLKDSKVIRLVEAEPDAIVVVEVLERSVEDGGMSMGSVLHTARLAVRATAGKYTEEFEGQTDSRDKWQRGGFSKAAEKVAKQLEDWVIENREALVALKK